MNMCVALPWENISAVTDDIYCVGLTRNQQPKMGVTFLFNIAPGEELVRNFNFK